LLLTSVRQLFLGHSKEGDLVNDEAMKEF